MQVLERQKLISGIGLDLKLADEVHDAVEAVAFGALILCGFAPVRVK